jgi:hypothetical protein
MDGMENMPQGPTFEELKEHAEVLMKGRDDDQVAAVVDALIELANGTPDDQRRYPGYTRQSFEKMINYIASERPGVAEYMEERAKLATEG